MTNVSLSQSSLMLWLMHIYELQAQVLLSLENFVNKGLLIWPGGDKTIDVEDEIRMMMRTIKRCWLELFIVDWSVVCSGSPQPPARAVSGEPVWWALAAQLTCPV